jgi:hypothetical protein
VADKATKRLSRLHALLGSIPATIAGCPAPPISSPSSLLRVAQLRTGAPRTSVARISYYAALATTAYAAFS